MPILYSRDAIAAPLRDLERVLGAIRSDGFRPDLTRSGYFVRGLGEDARQGPDHADDRYSDVSSSEASIDNDDRDKDLEAEELAQDAVLDEWVEYGSHVAAGGENPDVFRHKSWKASGTDSSKHFTLRCGQVTSRSEAMSVTDSVANFRARATKVSVSSEVVDLLVGAGVDSLSKFAFSSSYYPGAADDTPFVRFVASSRPRCFRCRNDVPEEAFP